MLLTDRHAARPAERDELEARLGETRRAVEALEARRDAAEELVRAETAGPIARLGERNAQLEGAIAALELERSSNHARARQLRARALSEGWARAGLVFGCTLGLGSAALLYQGHPGQAAISLVALISASLVARRAR